MLGKDLFIKGCLWAGCTLRDRMRACILHGLRKINMKESFCTPRSTRTVTLNYVRSTIAAPVNSKAIQ